MLYTIGIITCIVFYLSCLYLYFFFDTLLKKLEAMDNNLSNVRIDLATTSAEVQRAKRLVEREQQDAV